MTPTDFLQAKSRGAKLSMVTCYDFTSAKLLASSPVDGILVGDSAAMVIHGHATTLTATIEMMQLHVAAVARGAGDKLVVADMPFLTFRKGVPAAMEAAHSLMTAGAHALKVEGVVGHEDVIERLVGS
jgi:3-methyl-2-oxobutanoate hydroxymethyltransferase